MRKSGCVVGLNGRVAVKPFEPLIRVCFVNLVQELGNSLFASGDFVSAERAYRIALALHPEAADVWNNLAYALARQGRSQDAVRAADRALDLGGVRIDAYRDTLRELSEGPS